MRGYRQISVFVPTVTEDGACYCILSDRDNIKAVRTFERVNPVVKYNTHELALPTQYPQSKYHCPVWGDNRGPWDMRARHAFADHFPIEHPLVIEGNAWITHEGTGWEHLRLNAWIMH